ncbi:flagellar biosynthesis protein FlhB [Glycocaulis sp.]|uniref:flagellar biosynthesis protein FlhB n=1 Tax=Glycocaulis sp. TaxID=1969725 RepID=UPI003D2169AA
MAEGEDKSEKTEPPSQRKLDKAREKGDVPKSQEIPAWFILAAGLGVLAAFGPSMGGGLVRELSVFLAKPHEMSLDNTGALALTAAAIMKVMLVMGLAFGAIVAAALAGHFVQHGLIFTTSKLEPKLNKLNPVEGVKRILGPQGWVNFAKGLAKMTLVAIAITIVLWPRQSLLAGLPAVAPSQILVLFREIAIQLMLAALAVFAIIALADYIFQRQQFYNRNKMSRREIRDEFKESEGDPMVRARLRQIRQERARKRMMAAVPEAAVIITNPTHYAVALKYQQGITPAPICVAKGVEAVALKIREIAEEHGVPIVEDPPLARALHASVDLDEVIPPEHFAAVAKVIGYVLSLKKRR